MPRFCDVSNVPAPTEGGFEFHSPGELHAVPADGVLFSDGSDLAEPEYLEECLDNHMVWYCPVGARAWWCGDERELFPGHCSFVPDECLRRLL